MVSLVPSVATDRPTPPGTPAARPPSVSLAWGPLAGLIIVKMVINAAVAGRYGWHTDELYYADCGRHLAWGFVDFCLVTPLLAATSRVLAR